MILVKQVSTAHMNNNLTHPVQRGEWLWVHESLKAMVQGQPCAKEENPNTTDEGRDVAQVAVTIAENTT